MLHSTRVDLVVLKQFPADETAPELAAKIKDRWPQLPLLVLSDTASSPDGFDRIEVLVSDLEQQEIVFKHLIGFLARAATRH